MDGEFDFAQLVYQLLVVEKVRDLDEVARDMGLKYATLHARLNRRVHFRPAEIRALLGAAPDARLALYFLENTCFVPAQRAPPDADAQDALAHTHRSLFRIVDVLRMLRDSLADGRLDHREKLALIDEIERAEVELASLKAVVDKADNAHPVVV